MTVILGGNQPAALRITLASIRINLDTGAHKAEDKFMRSVSERLRGGDRSGRFKFRCRRCHLAGRQTGHTPGQAGENVLRHNGHQHTLICAAAEELQQRRGIQEEQSMDAAREIKEGSDRELFAREQEREAGEQSASLSDEFRKRVERRRKDRKRKEREDHGKNHGRERD